MRPLIIPAPNEFVRELKFSFYTLRPVSMNRVDEDSRHSDLKMETMILKAWFEKYFILEKYLVLYNLER